MIRSVRVPYRVVGVPRRDVGGPAGGTDGPPLGGAGRTVEWTPRSGTLTAGRPHGRPWVGYIHHVCAGSAWARRGPTRSCDVRVALHVLVFPPVFVLSYAVGYGTPSYV